MSTTNNKATEFINAFISATIQVLSVQAQVEAKAGEFAPGSKTGIAHGDISGVIGITAGSVNGTAVLTFPEQTFLKIISSMLGETYTQLVPDIVDGAGELTNMIFGQAKLVLNQKDYGVQMAIPSVVTGRDHMISGITKGAILQVPFESVAGNFFLIIALGQ